MKKTALITGASRGIGYATACAFAKAGYDLYLTCIASKNLLDSLASNLEDNYHITCHTFIGDMGDSSFVKDIFDQISSLDVLINNAGIAHIGLLSDMTVAQWQHVMDVNLNAVFYTSKCAIPLMLHEKKGKIINVSSVWGQIGASMEVAYCASKGGVNSFTKALAKELAPSNIQVNAIACGAIDTDMNRCFSKEELASLIAEIPADRLGKTNEVADLLLQIANAPEYMTGQIITLDGGWC